MKQIERYLPFSKSRMWRIMRDYYIDSGVSAWSGSVPFYVTSHPFMAHTYARLIVDAWQDWRVLSPKNESAIFSILELGAGTGKLSFHLLTALEELCSQQNLPFSQCRYIMTDLVEDNISFWEQQKQLAHFVELGVCDFALLDCEEFDSVHCRQTDTVITKNSLDGPLCVLANYIFDTLPTDIFQKKGDYLYESRVSLHTEESNLNDEQVIDSALVELQHDEARFQLPYYENVCDIALQKHFEEGGDGFFFLPSVSIQTLHTLSSFSKGQMIVLSSDKGYQKREDMAGLKFPSLTFHGSFSVMVNFVAIADYMMSQAHGFSALQEPRSGIGTCVMSMGLDLSQMPHFKQRIQQEVLDYSSGDYYTVYRGMLDTQEKQKADAIIALLAHSRWDTHLLQKFYQRLSDGLSDASYASKQFLKKHLSVMASRHYHMPGAHDTFFALGFLMYSMGDYDDSIAYYEQSLVLHPEHSSTHYNMGLSYYYAADKPKAKTCFEEALRLSPDNEETKEWLERASLDSVE